MATDKDTKQTTMLDSTANGKKNGAIEPLKFQAKRDIVVTERALQIRAEDLRNLAKKNQGEGYSHEAGVMLMDAATIEDRILPQLRAQRELPLVSYEDLQKQVNAAIAGMVRRMTSGLDAKGLGIPKPALESISARSGVLHGDLSSWIAARLRDAASAGYRAGYAARSLTPEGIAAEQLSQLNGGRAD